MEILNYKYLKPLSTELKVKLYCHLLFPTQLYSFIFQSSTRN